MKRNNRFVIWGLLAVGIALVIAWVFGVIAYGYEVDASVGIGTLRTQDVLLGAGSTLCFVAAIIVAVTSRRRARRHHV